MTGLLTDAIMRSAEARDHMRRGERLAAIGALSGLEDMLTDAVAFYGATIALHRRRRP